MIPFFPKALPLPGTLYRLEKENAPVFAFEKKKKELSTRMEATSTKLKRGFTSSPVPKRKPEKGFVERKKEGLMQKGGREGGSVKRRGSRKQKRSPPKKRPPTSTTPLPPEKGGTTTLQGKFQG